MLRRQNFGTLVILALFAEVLAFVVVVDWLGIVPALLIGLGSTLLGINRLRGIGTSALGTLRDVAGGRAAGEAAFVDGALGAAGAVLLILPGFLTDLVGLALLAPSCRDWVRRRTGVSASLAGPRSRGGPQTIDLDTHDWSRLDRMRPN